MTTTITEIPIDRAAKSAIDGNMTVEDRVWLALISYGKREIYQTVDDIAAKAGINNHAAYQAIYRMAQKGKLEVLKEQTSAGGRERVCGVKLNKAPDASEVIAKGAEKAKNGTSHSLNRRMEPKVAADLVELTTYMAKKVAVEKAHLILEEAGVEASIEFPLDPVAEEAIAIFNELVEEKKRNIELSIQVEAARKEIETLKHSHE